MGCVHSKCFDHSKKGCCSCGCGCNCNRCLHCSHCRASADDDAEPSRVDEDDRLQQHSHLIRHVLSAASLGSADVPSAGLRLHYSSLTQRGYYPGSPDRANQDSFCVMTQFQGNPDLHFFGVFDGHGDFGAECAAFVRDKLTAVLSADPRLWENPAEAYDSAFAATNLALHDSEIDDSMSGTTAITVLVRGDTLFVANVGDSRAVAGVWDWDRVVAEDLSSDHTPLRKDECERVSLCGARVLTMNQLESEGDEESDGGGDEESDDGDPPRLWVQNGMYPGTMFTRSVGDLVAESIGVVAVPEIKVVKITDNHSFFVIASDGVFQFLSSQAVVDMVSSFVDPRDACSKIVAESYKVWLEREGRTDDTTIIIVRIKDLSKMHPIV
ncbi:probable protein phosphatase 2C 35 [Musa acuminata AAA Group]|uniref:probable protein phosphatase 2C 35 n=1 Tax=Musa acuminata AAA Group TaxID=214697 RepID=UPI0031DED665